MNELDEIVETLSSGSSFLITSHENPDCDALGSTLSLGLALEMLNKDVVLYNKNKIPNHLKFLPKWGKINNNINEIRKEKFDCIVLLDCADTKRPGLDFKDLLDEFSNNSVIVVDHHKSNSDGIYKKSLIDIEAASTGILVYKILKKLNVQIDKDIANCILATIIGDTGSYKYSNTNSEAFKVSAELVELGADTEFISQSIYENEPLNKILLVSEALKTLEIDATKMIASVYVDNEMFHNTNTKREDTEGIVNIPRSINGVSVALFFRQESKNDEDIHWKVSLRSKDNVDVSKIAKNYGGGGHYKAAGFSIKGNLENVKKEIISVVLEEIK